MGRSARCRGIGDAVWLLLAYYDLAQRGQECTDEQIAQMLDASIEDVHCWRDVLQETGLVQPTMFPELSRDIYMVIDRGKVFNFTRHKEKGLKTDDEFLRACGIKFKPDEEKKPDPLEVVPPDKSPDEEKKP